MIGDRRDRDRLWSPVGATGERRDRVRACGRRTTISALTVGDDGVLVTAGLHARFVQAELKVLRLARSQHGLVSWEQATRAGLTAGQIRHRVQAGWFRRVRRGVYALAGVPATYEQAVLAAVLAAQGPAWVSHASAAKLHGLLLASPPDAIDLVRGAGSTVRQRGIRSHRSSCLPAPDLRRRLGIPVLSPARVICDLSAGLSVRQLGRLMDRAERDGLCRAVDVQRCAGRLGEARGRSLTTVALALELRVPGYGPGDSDLEQDALAALADAGLPLPVRHYAIVVDGRYHEIDLAYPDERIAIELLGFRDHGHRSALDDDSERTRRLVLNGRTLLPFTTAASTPELVSDVGRLLQQRLSAVRRGRLARRSQLVSDRGAPGPRHAPA